MAPGSGENLRNKVIRRAWQLMREHEWVTDDTAPAPAASEPPPPTQPRGRADPDDTTEPHFVIPIPEQLEQAGSTEKTAPDAQAPPVDTTEQA